MVSDLNILLIKGVKLPHKKSLIFDQFCLTSRIFGIGATIRIGQEMLYLPNAGFLFKNYLKLLDAVFLMEETSHHLKTKTV